MTWTEECLQQICYELRAIRTRLCSDYPTDFAVAVVKETEAVFQSFVFRLADLEDHERKT